VLPFLLCPPRPTQTLSCIMSSDDRSVLLPDMPTSGGVLLALCVLVRTFACPFARLSDVSRLWVTASDWLYTECTGTLCAISQAHCGMQCRGFQHSIWHGPVRGLHFWKEFIASMATLFASPLTS
jgi:hypothetical protein